MYTHIYIYVDVDAAIDIGKPNFRSDFRVQLKTPLGCSVGIS